MSVQLPKISEIGKIFYVTAAFPPVPAGSSIINRNLLSKFDPDSFKVFTTKSDISAKVESFGKMDVVNIFKSYYFSSRLNHFISKYQLSSATKKLIKYAEKESPAAIVGVFPDYFFLKIARDASKELQIPLIAYLHDTIRESSEGSRLSKEAENLQEKIFNEASAILVMSEGMCELYKRKYGIESTSLEHTYLEKIPDRVSQNKLNDEAFWGGDIYTINKNSVNRIIDALKINNFKLFIASGHKMSYFEGLGIDGESINVGFFSKRDEYLENLNRYGVLVLALDWPDESPIHKDELATIFPTKTPEYLASGAPIIVHCPEDYFMAQFFKKNDCGIVINERSSAKLEETLKLILSGEIDMNGYRKNALVAARLFNVDRLVEKFRKISNQVSKLKWNEKINYSQFD